MRTILLADNLPGFVKVRTTFLEQADFNVLTAENPQDARRILLESNIHLALLDIRLVDDNNPNDQSGIDIANDYTFHSIPKIIITGYPSVETSRKSLSPSRDSLPPAVSYLSKTESMEVMLDTINQIFTEFVRINENLIISENPSKLINFPGIVRSLEPGLDEKHIVEKSKNLSDLFRKLFFDFDRIDLENIYFHKGDHVTLLVGSHDANYTEHFVVTCSIQKPERFKKNQSIPFQTSLRDIVDIQPVFEESVFYILSAWRIEDAEPTELRPLLLAISEKKETLTHTALVDILDRVLPHWNRRGIKREVDQSLAKIYEDRFDIISAMRSTEIFENKLSSILSRSYEKHVIQEFNISDDQILIKFSPAKTIKVSNFMLDDFVESIPSLNVDWSDSAGVMDLETILINHDGKVWLTDFSQIGSYPIWHSYTCLLLSFYDAAVQLFSVENLVNIERIIHQNRPLGESFRIDGIDSEYRKFAGWILLIQDKSEQVGGRDLRPYDICLFFNLLVGLGRYSSEISYSKNELSIFLNRLILLSILIEKINSEKNILVENSDSSRKLERLIIDFKTSEVRVGKKLVNFTETEYKILRTLYEQKEKVCSKKFIATEVFGLKNFGEAEDAMVNTHIGRIRQKIDPKYLITIRSRGVKLITKPE